MIYSALAAIAYLVFCVASSVWPLPRRAWAPLGAFMHIAALPAVLFSVVLIGFGLPVVAFFWLRFYDRRYATDAPPRNLF